LPCCPFLPADALGFVAGIHRTVRSEAVCSMMFLPFYNIIDLKSIFADADTSIMKDC
jgi:hypothetical protein